MPGLGKIQLLACQLLAHTLCSQPCSWWFPSLPPHQVCASVCSGFLLFLLSPFALERFLTRCPSGSRCSLLPLTLAIVIRNVAPDSKGKQRESDIFYNSSRTLNLTQNLTRRSTETLKCEYCIETTENEKIASCCIPDQLHSGDNAVGTSCKQRIAIIQPWKVKPIQNPPLLGRDSAWWCFIGSAGTAWQHNAHVSVDQTYNNTKAYLLEMDLKVQAKVNSRVAVTFSKCLLTWALLSSLWLLYPGTRFLLLWLLRVWPQTITGISAPSRALYCLFLFSLFFFNTESPSMPCTAPGPLRDKISLMIKSKSKQKLIKHPWLWSLNKTG